MTTLEKCWTEGCDKPQSTERIGYWCTEHHDERRARITKLMSELANDSQGNPRKGAVAHLISVSGNHYGWQWNCSCGKGSSTSAKTEGLASAGAARHIRATTKAAA